MIGIILVTHGRLALDFIEALEHIVGRQDNIKAICIENYEDVEASQQAIINASESMNEGEGVLIISDVFGSTPANITLDMVDKKDVIVLSGVNLPLLVKVDALRREPKHKRCLRDIAMEACEAGRKGICFASTLLEQIHPKTQTHKP
ncbi:MAG: PTS fructose transporter subunit IIA [Alphaproteobacteria bacterium GM7ARS4]|nr:PTS fructose transporter subunit IIA [Alphaproteobacteria bacterium GM7ARS4]